MKPFVLVLPRQSQVGLWLLLTYSGPILENFYCTINQGKGEMELKKNLNNKGNT